MPQIESDNTFLTSIKGYNSVLICQNVPISNPGTLLTISTHIPSLKKIGKGMPKIEIGNKFLTSIKGRYSTYLPKFTHLQSHDTPSQNQLS